MKTLHAALTQARGDLRPIFLGVSVVLVIAPVIFFIFVFRNNTLNDFAQVPAGQIVLAGLVGGYCSLIVAQIASEYYVDRIGGALLRVRTFPNGPKVWTLGKTISTLIITFTPQLMLLILSAIFIPNSPFSLGSVLLAALIAFFVCVASTPLGFIIGAFLRGTYTQLLAYFVIILYMATSGLFFPLDVLPRWAQLIHQVLPGYWSGHLTRWALVDDTSFELSGQFTPLLAFGILTIWLVVGFALLPLIIRRSFRQESMGSLASLQEKTRSQAGV